MVLGKRFSQIIGIFFILPLFFYGIGNSLLAPLLNVGTSSMSMVNLGGVLIILNSITAIIISVLLFPYLKPFQKSIALGYLICRILEGILLIIGLIALFSLFQLNTQILGFDSKSIEFEYLRNYASGFNFYSYQIAMILFGLGSIPFCWLMYKYELVPKYFALFGGFGYTLLLLGSICEILGFQIGIMLSIPGGLFELSFGVRLLIKGFGNLN